MFDSFELNLFKWNLRGKNPLTICFFGDNHSDAKASVDDHIEDIRKRTEKMPYESVLFIGMGDYIDFASTSERKAIHNGSLHDTTIDKLNDIAQADTDKLVKKLEFMRGRLIGLHNGNHAWMYPDGTCDSERMASALGCRHLGYSAYTRIKVSGVVRGGTSRSIVDIFSSHGKGSGRLIGSQFNTVEQMSEVFHDADLYAMGHTHAIGSLPSTRLHVEENVRTGELELKEKVRLMIRTGSALRGYEAGKKSYISKALYKPCSLGFPMATIEWKRVSTHGGRQLVKEVHGWA